MFYSILAAMKLNELSELDILAKREAKKYPHKREKYASVAIPCGRSFVGIVGPRGVGKSVLLKQLASELDYSFYLSLDTVEEESLFELARNLHERFKVRLLLFDEIHFKKEYQKELKKIYDFLEIRVIFSSSVSLSLYESAYDLSRRVRLEHLLPFSFREFLFFKHGVRLPALSLYNILANRELNEYLRYEFAFEEYLKGGLFPFSLEEPEIKPVLQNVLNTIIRRDIPQVAHLNVDELDLIEKTVRFIGRSEVDGISYSSVARNIGITKYKSEQYVHLLEKAFVINPVFPAGTNVLREPKILMFLPYRLLFKEYGDSIGALREDFLSEALLTAGISFSYLKSTRGAKTPDYLLNLRQEQIIVEVGGKGKGREQFKGVDIEKSKKRLILSQGGGIEGIKRPLLLIGFL